MTRQRVALISLSLLLTTAVYLVVTILAAIVGWAVAHADAGVPTTDVPVQKYGWWAGVLVLYMAVRWFLKKNESEMWLAHGRTLSIATAILSVLGSVVGWRFGMDPDTIGFAVAGAVPLAIPSTVSQKPAPVTASGETNG
jgi:cation transporter-like permease